jgi:NADP-dependent 3-hydroxy acid dehydrogenase YdfG
VATGEEKSIGPRLEKKTAMNLRGKVMLITGASSGIGAATARAAACEGAYVLLLARSQEKLDRLAEEIRQEGSQAWAVSH